MILAYLILAYLILVGWAIYALNPFTEQGWRKELWKTYAIALEVVAECQEDLEEKIAGEGCATRFLRRLKLFEHERNAHEVLHGALKQLIEAGEYEYSEADK